MYIYFDRNGYIYGYGSEPEDGSIEVDSIPEEVDCHLGAYKYINGQYIADEKRKKYLEKILTLELELEELDAWFNWYDQQNIQYQRSIRSGTPYNKDMKQLDSQATVNAKRTTEIRTILKQIKNKGVFT